MTSSRPSLRAGGALRAVIAVLAVAAPAASAGAWTRPVALMTEARAQYQLGEAPLVTYRIDGTAFVVWKSPVGPAPWTELRVTTHHGGGGWTAPLRIGHTKRIGFIPSLTVDALDVAVAWPERHRSREAERLVVWTSRLGSPATTDGPPTQAGVSAPTVALTGSGEVLATWLEKETAWWGVRGADGTWSRTRLDPASRMLDLTLAAASDGTALATYRPAPDYLTSTATRAPGGAFTPAGTIPVPGNGFAPEIRRGGAPAVVVWGYPNLGAWTLSGGAWAGPNAIAGGAFSSVRVGQLPDGRLIAVWRDSNRTSTSRIMVAQETAPGGPWTTPAGLTPERAGLGEPGLAVGTDGRVLVVFTRSGAIVARVRPAGASVWSNSAAVSPAGRSCRAPAVSVAPTGRALAAFVCRGPAKRFTLMAAELPASGGAGS
ncbi:MAG: hypothetical protein U0Y82_10485 [Thermoleophilia bacterium]